MVKTEQTADWRRPNRLDKTMTPAQVARRRFKSSLPRKIGVAELTPELALLRSMELLGRFRDEVVHEEQTEDSVRAALVYYQPHTKGKEAVLAQVLPIPERTKFPSFFEKVLALDKPVFLGMLFWQHDAKAAKDGDTKQANVIFGCEFTKSHAAEARLLAARQRQSLDGLKTILN
jgi:hypothetical protein